MAKKRQDGEGNIIKRSDGRWQGSLTAHSPDGRSKRVYVYGKTASEVREKLGALRKEQERGVNLLSDNPTVQQYLANWLEYTVKPEAAPKTYESYEETCRNRITSYVGSVKLKNLKPEHIQRMVVQLQERELSQRSIQYAVGVLSRALNKAVLHGHIARNPAQHIKPRCDRRQIEPLTQEQARVFLDAVAGHRLEPLYRIALGLGMRRGEILALRWSDVDLTAGKLVIRKAKTKAGERTLLLPDKLVKVLQAHWAFQQQERRLLDTEWREHGLVFPSEVGTPLLPHNLLRHFKAALKRAGLPKHIRFHDLRHSCATFLVAQGVHPRVVMELLGHSRFSLTMELYSHVAPETQREALNGIADMF
ncbi:MAG: tyrosine-type recombinase/integrase [Chloroflexaceae bacterium]|nr:tyrosine-type recombinase/integrase [Chloroflexaceae bacterium]